MTGLKSLARCTELRLLKVGYCMDITNAGLVHIGATCKNLRELDCYRFVLFQGRDLFCDFFLCRIKEDFCSEDIVI